MLRQNRIFIFNGINCILLAFTCLSDAKHQHLIDVIKSNMQRIQCVALVSCVVHIKHDKWCFTSAESISIHSETDAITRMHRWNFSFLNAVDWMASIYFQFEIKNNFKVVYEEKPQKCDDRSAWYTTTAHMCWTKQDESLISWILILIQNGEAEKTTNNV